MSEKVYIIAGNEFGDRKGHILVIYKALYSLRSSRQRWYERFSDVLRSLGFELCTVEPDIWLRRNEDHYEYVAVYIDDLAIAMKDPQAFIDILVLDHKFKLKGTGDIAYHLGCDFFRDDDGTFCMAPIKYIEKMADNYKRLFGCKPRTVYASPLEKNDHPELDTTDLLDEHDVTVYKYLIRPLQ